MTPTAHHPTRTEKNRQSIRLKGYDYSTDGAYLITICIKNREHLLGEIQNAKMRLNDAGRIAQKCWLEIPRQYPNVILDTFVIMPNHTHGILIIENNDTVGASIYGAQNDTVGASIYGAQNDTVGASIYGAQKNKTDTINNTQNNKTDTTNNTETDAINRAPTTSGGFAEIHNPMSGKSIGRIIRWFKGRCTFEINKIQNELFSWQRNYHDRIIRDEAELNRIREYIWANPQNWENDQNNLIKK